MNVHCIVKVEEKVVQVYRGEKLLGWLRDNATGEPELTLFSDMDGIVKMPCSDFDIINDNWNHLQEVLMSLPTPKRCECGWFLPHKICQKRVDTVE